MRLRAYIACLIAAFCVYALVHAMSAGALFLAACAVVLAGLVLSLVGPSSGAERSGLLPAATLAAAALALTVPLAGAVADGTSLPEAIRHTTVWPQILVLLFAARILAERAEQRFAALWANPLGSGHAETQSMAAAMLLGCCLTLVFYQFLAGVTVAPERLDPWAVVVRAFTGQTAIHVAIVLLFFVIVAAIVDAALLSLNDGLALADLRRLCREHRAATGTLTAAVIAAQLAGPLAHATHTRTMRFIADAARADDPAGARAPRSLDVFHHASRRLIRALISFLPLLGFLGTVIGLTAAIGGLPEQIGPAAQGEMDISGSLFGLAVKFETTLLGLAGGLAASLLLSLLEKREAELEAASRRLIEACPDDG